MNLLFVIAIGYVNRTVSMYLYFHDGSSTFRNRFQKVFQNSISICNRYGTRVLKVFQILDRNMAMQTATLRSTESNGKSTKGK
ncbi:conserved hypothetical protein, partial [Trichinella spiralis]|uniref:hypothetical protein n=1 Tax=Trichinella spiralis TaxID=6334 RepID=UPI0001EFD228